VIFPSSALHGIDNPAERDAPYVVFLTLAERGPETVLRRKDLAAQQDGLSRVGTGKVGSDGYVGNYESR